MRILPLIFVGLIAASPTSHSPTGSPRPQQQAAKPAQSPATTAPKAAAAGNAAATSPPAANPADVATPEALLAATYGVISGPAGQPRDWDRFRSLFIPGARLISNNPHAPGTLPQVIEPDRYAALAAPYFDKNGFFEMEAARRSKRFGPMMDVWSTYESRHTAADPQPFARGINSFQLFYDGKRWWIVTIYWVEETPDLPLPKEFLTAPK
jgi:hypothetical protein